MSKILAALSGCSMAACFLGGALAIAAHGLLSASLPNTAPKAEPAVQPKPVPPSKPTPPAKPKPQPQPQPKPQPRNPRNPH